MGPASPAAGVIVGCGVEFGEWGTDARGVDPEADPFEILMQGLGAFAYRRTLGSGSIRASRDRRRRRLYPRESPAGRPTDPVSPVVPLDAPVHSAGAATSVPSDE